MQDWFHHIAFLLIVFSFGFSWPTASKVPAKETPAVRTNQKTDTKTQTVTKLNISNDTKVLTPTSKIGVVPHIPNVPDLKSVQNIQRQLDNVIKINQSMKMNYALQASEIARMQNQVLANQQILREIKIPPVYKPSQRPVGSLQKTSSSSDSKKTS